MSSEELITSGGRGEMFFFFFIFYGPRSLFFVLFESFVIGFVWVRKVVEGGLLEMIYFMGFLMGWREKRCVMCLL